MSNSPVRFGLIGAGAIAQAYAQAFTQCANAKLVAVADVRYDAAAALAEGCGATAYDSHSALLQAADLDAVVLCTPPVSHAPIAQDVMKAGLHLLCEKPLSLDVVSAKAMQATAQQAGVLLTMGSKFRYAEDVVKAKSILASGLLGEVVLFENAFTTRIDMSQRWNSQPRLSGGGVLIDNGTHSVDIMRYLVGAIARVQVIEGKRVQGLEVEDTVRLFAESDSGVMGSIDLSWSIHKELDYYVRLYGSNGTISIGWSESKYRQAGSRDWVVFGNGYNKVQAFSAQLTNFAAAIRGQEPLRITAADAIASVEVIEAAYAALRLSQWTAIDTSAQLAPTQNDIATFAIANSVS